MSEIPETFVGADITGDLDPAAFNFDHFIAGIRPTVRAVRVYARPDLEGDIDALKDRLRVATGVRDEDRAMSDDSPESLRQQLRALAGQFEAASVLFKVEARSDKRVAQVEQVAKDAGVTDEADLELHRLVDAIIEPAGITVTHLQALAEVSEIQVKMLVAASSFANNQPPRVDLPFSSEPSKPQRARRSSSHCRPPASGGGDRRPCGRSPRTSPPRPTSSSRRP